MKLRIALWTGGILLAVGLLTGLGGIGFLYSGLYDIAARRPHLLFTQRILSILQQRSVAYHARDLEAPPLDDAELVRHGAQLYDELCLVCHGAPGVSRDRPGIGLNPNPPPLVRAARNWTVEELYWIIANGLKMAGMPAFALGRDTTDLWAMTAFVVRMNSLSPAEFGQMRAAVRGELDPAAVPWLPPDAGHDQLAAEGDVERGRALIDAYGCGACHVVPGASRWNGKAGPPLTRWGRRHYIAGRIVNTPANLVRWIVDPQAIEPGTAMPDLGVTDADAWDIAAYLMTLDS